MTPSTTPRTHRNAMVAVAHLLCAAAAFLGTACSTAPEGDEELEAASVTANAESDPGAASQTGFTSTASPVDDHHVSVLGMVEVISADTKPGATSTPIAGAEICLTVSGTTTCTTTDEAGTYAFEGLTKTTEPAELIATHEGFATTVTTLSIGSSASHALGMIPESQAPSADLGTVLVRSLVKAYSMTDLVSGVHVDVAVGDQKFTATTEANGSTVIGSVVPGPVTAHGSANTLPCELWAGSSSETLTAPIQATAGVVTQVDVLCNVDANDKR